MSLIQTIEQAKKLFVKIEGDLPPSIVTRIHTGILGSDGRLKDLLQDKGRFFIGDNENALMSAIYNFLGFEVEFSFPPDNEFGEQLKVIFKSDD